MKGQTTSGPATRKSETRRGLMRESSEDAPISVATKTVTASPVGRVVPAIGRKAIGRTVLEVVPCRSVMHKIPTGLGFRGRGRGLIAPLKAAAFPMPIAHGVDGRSIVVGAEGRGATETRHCLSRARRPIQRLIALPDLIGRSRGPV